MNVCVCVCVCVYIYIYIYIHIHHIYLASSIQMSGYSCPSVHTALVLGEALHGIVLPSRGPATSSRSEDGLMSGN